MKILLAVDVRDHPTKLLGLALPILRRLGEKVDLVYLSEAWARVPPEGDPRRAAWQEARDIDEAELRLLSQMMPPSIRGEARVVAGSARSALPPLTEEYDLLLLGTRGERSGLTRLVLGSVADTLVREARCAVTVLR